MKTRHGSHSAQQPRVQKNRHKFQFQVTTKHNETHKAWLNVAERFKQYILIALEQL